MLKYKFFLQLALAASLAACGSGLKLLDPAPAQSATPNTLAQTSAPQNNHCASDPNTCQTDTSNSNSNLPSTTTGIAPGQPVCSSQQNGNSTIFTCNCSNTATSASSHDGGLCPKTIGDPNYCSTATVNGGIIATCTCDSTNGSACPGISSQGKNIDHGVYFKGTKRVYVSSGPLTCDSNVLLPSQDMLRLTFTALDANVTYQETENFYMTKTNPAVVPEPVGYDAQCKDKNYPSVAYAANANQVPFPLNGQVTIDAVDAQTGQIQGTISDSDKARSTSFVISACPEGAPEPFSGLPSKQCVFAESCTPLTASCKASNTTP